MKPLSDLLSRLLDMTGKRCSVIWSPSPPRPLEDEHQLVQDWAYRVNDDYQSTIRASPGMTRDVSRRRLSAIRDRARKPPSRTFEREPSMVLAFGLEGSDILVWHEVQGWRGVTKSQHAALNEEVLAWCEENLSAFKWEYSRACNHFVNLYFENDVDAVHFKLRWL